MPPVDDLIFRPRPSVASDALLSAALGGLLTLAASCGTSGDATTPDAGSGNDSGSIVDAGFVADGGSVADAGATADAGTVTDAGTPLDTGTPLDAGLPLDASLPMDASPSMDASVPTDTGPPVDMGPRDAPCDVDPARAITSTDAAPGMTLETFTAMCDALGGFIEIHPHCGGMNTCRGISYDSGTGILTEHTCAGLNTCTGYSCILP